MTHGHAHGERTSAGHFCGATAASVAGPTETLTSAATGRCTADVACGLHCGASIFPCFRCPASVARHWTGRRGPVSAACHCGAWYSSVDGTTARRLSRCAAAVALQAAGTRLLADLASYRADALALTPQHLASGRSPDVRQPNRRCIATPAAGVSMAGSCKCWNCGEMLTAYHEVGGQQ